MPRGTRSSSPQEDENDDEEETLSAEEVAQFGQPVAAPSPERAAKMASDLAEKKRLKEEGALRHGNEEIMVLSTGALWRAFLQGRPGGSVGDGATPAEALSALKEKLAAE